MKGTKARRPENKGYGQGQNVAHSPNRYTWKKSFRAGRLWYIDDEEYVWNVWKVLEILAAVAFVEAAAMPVIADGCQ